MTENHTHPHPLAAACPLMCLTTRLSTRASNALRRTHVEATSDAVALARQGRLGELPGMGQTSTDEVMRVLGEAGLLQVGEPTELQQLAEHLARVERKIDALLKIARPE